MVKNGTRDDALIREMEKRKEIEAVEEVTLEKPDSELRDRFNEVMINDSKWDLLKTAQKKYAEYEDLVMVVKVASGGYNAGNFAKITINDVEVPLKMNEKIVPEDTIHDRGLHVVVINPHDGRLDSVNVFDTYATSLTLRKFISTAIFKKDYIVAAACKDDMARLLHKKCKDWFEHMGSKQIYNLKYRMGFAFIGVIGKKTCVERISVDDT